MTATFEGAQLQLDLVDPASIELVRLFRHAGGHWEPPPPAYRNLRVDATPGKQDEYAVLYTADCIEAAAIECRILQCDTRDRYAYDIARTQEYSVVRYRMNKPSIFIPIDGDNKTVLGLRGLDPDYQRHRAVAYELFTRFGRVGGVVHGLSWESYHRNQPGRVCALWHHHKDSVGLEITSPTPYEKLAEDAKWRALLAANPGFEGLAT